VARTKKTKTLTLDEVRKIDEKNFGGVKKIKVGDYVVSIKEKFRPSEIAEMIKHTINVVGEIVEQNLDISSTLAPLLSTIMIKHFTDVEGIPDDLAGLIEATRYLSDNNFLNPIISQFDEEEMRKVNEHLAKVIKGISDINTSIELKQAAKDLVEEVKE
jgi:hypothetical protein